MMLQWIRPLGAAFLALALLSCATAPTRPAGPPPTPIAEIPYRIDYQGWITVDTMVNASGPYDFIVDSGATITSAFENLASRQIFERSPRPDIRILGLTGARKLPAYVLGDIEIASERLENHVGVILPDWAPPNTPPQGIIGLDFLTRYDILFDASSRTMRLYAKETESDAIVGNWARAPLESMIVDEESLPIFRTAARVRGESIPCIIDLGASGTIFNSAAYRAMTGGLYVDRQGMGGFSTGTRIQDVFDTFDGARPVKISKLQIGNGTWFNHVAIVYDAQIFTEFGVQNRPFCLVGADVFADRSFLLDFEDEEIRIGPRRRREG
ncbi:aspartyl protease family protein [Hyphococcus sp.]|uniref:aspartyl protease family protein n=1 Tax=Hyphococcus sp. TaxID=2038636 RepID=UPI003CCB7F4A